MRFSLLRFIIIYFFSNKAISNDITVPDFVDYDEDGSENNLSLLLKNTAKFYEDTIEPLTPIAYYEKLQEISTNRGTVTDINNDIVTINAENYLSEQDQNMNTAIVKGHKTDDYQIPAIQDLVWITQDTTYSETNINDLNDITEIKNDVDYLNHPYPPVVTESVLNDTAMKKIITDDDRVDWRRQYSVPSIIKPKLDIPGLVNLLKNVSKDYENNFDLLNKFNQSLMNFSVETCEPFTLPTPTRTTTINFNDSFLIAKCFVCGLKDEGIPSSTACADAFSSDFMPLVKLDPKAREKLASYRKYCRYLNVHNYLENAAEPRSVFGRFTGGCSVRWVDLTGVYSQRTCRIRRSPVTGKHFGSKRMAKLEKTLEHLDNGCIISPMATLVPVNRGISLYARFHACVCSGSWCNMAEAPQKSITSYFLIFLLFWI